MAFFLENNGNILTPWVENLSKCGNSQILKKAKFSTSHKFFWDLKICNSLKNQNVCTKTSKKLFRFLTKIQIFQIFNEKLNFWSKFYFCSKIVFLSKNQNFLLWHKFWDQKFFFAIIKSEKICLFQKLRRRL